MSITCLLFPSPIKHPKLKFLEDGEVLVIKISPKPANDKIVFFLPPNANNNSLTVFRAEDNKLNIVYNNCSFTFREFIKYVKRIQCKKYRKELLLALKFAKYKLSIKD